VQCCTHPEALGQQRESIDVIWSDDREVATVECRDRLLIQPLGRRDYRGIDGAQGHVAVLVHQFGDSKPIGRSNWFDSEVATSEVAEEPNLSCGTKSSTD